MSKKNEQPQQQKSQDEIEYPEGWNGDAQTSTTNEQPQQQTAPAAPQPPAPKDKVRAALGKATKPGTLLGLKATDIAQVFSSMQATIAQALPKHMNAERMIQLATRVVARNPAIAECTAPSIIGAIVEASVLGLNPIIGECYFVPYNMKIKGENGQQDRWEKVCQMQIGYKGMISLARRSGELQTIFACVVHQGEKFSYNMGLNPNIEHIPNDDFAEKPITHVYAVAHYKGGGYNFVVLTAKQVNAYRLRNRMQKGEASGAWETDEAAMFCKTAIRRLDAYLPKSDEYLRAMDRDEKVIANPLFSSDGSGMEDASFSEVQPAQLPEGGNN